MNRRVMALLQCPVVTLLVDWAYYSSLQFLTLYMQYRVRYMIRNISVFWSSESKKVVVFHLSIVLCSIAQTIVQNLNKFGT